MGIICFLLSYCHVLRGSRPPNSVPCNVLFFFLSCSVGCDLQFHQRRSCFDCVPKTYGSFENGQSWCRIDLETCQKLAAKNTLNNNQCVSSSSLFDSVGSWRIFRLNYRVVRDMVCHFTRRGKYLDRVPKTSNRLEMDTICANSLLHAQKSPIWVQTWLREWYESWHHVIRISACCGSLRRHFSHIACFAKKSLPSDDHNIIWWCKFFLRFGWPFALKCACKPPKLRSANHRNLMYTGLPLRGNFRGTRLPVALVEATKIAFITEFSSLLDQQCATNAK